MFTNIIFTIVCIICGIIIVIDYIINYFDMILFCMSLEVMLLSLYYISTELVSCY